VPPSETRWNLSPVARAMLWPSEDRAASGRVELAHREVLEDALLDLVEAVVIALEHGLRRRDVDALGVEPGPGQRHHEVEVGALHRVLGTLLGHALEPLELLADLLERLLGHAGGLERRAQLGEVRRAVLALAELALDLLELLAQQHLLLAPVDGLARLLLDVLGELHDLDALREHGRDTLEARAHVDGLDQQLLLGRLDVEEAGDQVGERVGRLDALQRIGELGRRRRQELERLLRKALQVQDARLDVRAAHAGRGQVLDAGEVERHAGLEVEHPKAPLALHDEVVGAVLGRDVAQHARHRAVVVQVRRRRIVDRRIALQQETHLALGAHGLARAGHRLLAVHDHGRHGTGKQHHVADRQDDQYVLARAAGRRRLECVPGIDGVVHARSLGPWGTLPVHAAAPPAEPAPAPAMRVAGRMWGPPAGD
jgi:hypothetical protein